MQMTLHLNSLYPSSHLAGTLVYDSPACSGYTTPLSNCTDDAVSTPQDAFYFSFSKCYSPLVFNTEDNPISGTVMDPIVIQGEGLGTEVRRYEIENNGNN